MSPSNTEVPRSHRLARGTPHRGETLLPAQLEHRIETLRMARHQNQQRIGMTGEQLTMSRQYHFVFTVMGAGGDPDRTLLRLPLRTQLGGTLQQCRVDGQVELDRAGHFDSFRTRAQITKALGLGLGLHREQAHLGEHRPGQFA